MLIPQFTPSQGGNDSYTKILLHFEGTDGSTTITDSNVGGSAHTWTNHTGSIATAQSKFDGSSYNCGAATGYVDTPDHADFTLGSGDFTIDCWFYRSGGDGVLRVLFGQVDSALTTTARAADGGLGTDNKLFFSVCSGSSQTVMASTSTFTSTGWHHFACVRTGNTLKMFIDGVQEGGNVSFSSTVNDSIYKLSVGRWGEYSAGYFWNGYIDEFRYSVGIARWTANFTPPPRRYD